MSHYDVCKVVCEQCAYASDFRSYTSVNLSDAPHLKAAVLSDDIFKFECPHCHHVTYIHHPLFYHDSSRNLMMQYGAEAEPFEENMRTLRMEGLLLNEMTIRFTNNWSSFKEKIRIFDHHRDDRLIEIYKSFLIQNFRRTYPDAGQIVALYDAAPEEVIVVISENEQPKVYAFPNDWYDANMADAMIRKILAHDTSLVVDQSFAEKVSTMMLGVSVAHVQLAYGIRRYLFHSLDQARVGDHVLVYVPGEGETEGVIRRLDTADVRDVEINTPLILRVLRKRDSQDDSITEDLEKLCHTMNDVPDDSVMPELLNVLCDVKVFLPLVRDKDTGELTRQMVFQEDSPPVLPLFTREMAAKTFSPLGLVFEDSFVDIARLYEGESVLFSINPHLHDIVLLPERIKDLVLDYEKQRRFTYH